MVTSSFSHGAAANVGESRPSSLLDLSVGIKVALPAAAAVVFLIVAALVGSSSISALSAVVEDLFGVRLARLNTAAQIKQEITAVNGGFYTAVAWTASNYDAAQIERLVKEQGKRLKAMEELLVTEAGRSGLTEQEKTQITSIQASFKTYKEAATNALDMLDQGLSYATMYFGAANTAYGTLSQQLDGLVAAQEAAVKEQYQFTIKFASQRTATLWVVTGISLLVAVLLTLYFRAGMIRTTAAIRDAAENLQSGNLRERVQVVSSDEIGQAAQAFNSLIGKFQALIGDIRESARNASKLAENLAEAASTVADSATRQSDSATTTGSAVIQMSASIASVAENTRAAAGVSQSAGKTCTATAAKVDELEKSIRGVAQTVDQSAQVVEDLGKRSGEIYGIVQTIRDIADQTNLLALNAAIEAARAGEQGRGFAVVADEVRKLAERSSTATQGIAEVIQTVQSDTDKAVETMKRGATEVSAVVAMMQEAASAMRQIEQDTVQIGGMTGDISRALSSQETSARAITGNVESFASLADENAQASRQSRTSAQELRDVASRLQTSVEAFTV